MLEQIRGPADLQHLSQSQLSDLAQEIREFLIHKVAATGGHLGSNLGVVELTLALHRVFRSPEDVVLWDTGHQTYTHKLLTGRAGRVGPAHSSRREVCPGIRAGPSRSTTGSKIATPPRCSATRTGWRSRWPP